MAENTATQERKTLWPGPIFLTATDIEPKKFNEWFLRIQDFEFSDGLEDSSWVLFTSPDVPDAIYDPTIPPLDVPNNNAFTDNSIDEIRDFVVSHEEELKRVHVDCSHWVVVDQEGLETMTVIMVERPYEPGEDGEVGKASHDWRGVRLRCEDVWSMFCNLRIANMGFEDFVVGNAQEDGRRMYEKDGTAWGEGEVNKKMEAELKKLKDEGHV